MILLACKDGRKVYNDLLHIRIVYFEIYKLYNKKGTDGVDGTWNDHESHDGELESSCYSCHNQYFL